MGQQQIKQEQADLFISLTSFIVYMILLTILCIISPNPIEILITWAILVVLPPFVGIWAFLLICGLTHSMFNTLMRLIFKLLS